MSTETKARLKQGASRLEKHLQTLGIAFLCFVGSQLWADYKDTKCEVRQNQADIKGMESHLNSHDEDLRNIHNQLSETPVIFRDRTNSK